MFIHHEKLPHLLNASDYSSVDVWREEIDHLFHKSWQYVGLARDVEKEGQYLAREVAGVPIVVRNFGKDGVHAFRNVCGHRGSMIVRPGTGSAPTFQCMYHGWEYGARGQLTHLPDGKCFKGIKGAEVCLNSVRLDRIGPMLFVNLGNPGTTFRESLGDLAPELDAYFDDHRPCWHWITDHDANWKVIEENAVESYHVPMAHPTTFKDYKAEELHDHRLTKAYTRYADLEPWKDGVVDRGFKFLSRMMIPRPNYERFKHTHIFPNNLLYYGELFSTWAFVQPLTPERTRYEILGFIPRKLRAVTGNAIVLRAVIQPLIKQFAKILLEDMEIWPKIHHGLKNSPFPGVLSCREERVYAFQEYVVENLPSKAAQRHAIVPPPAPESRASL